MNVPSDSVLLDNLNHDGDDMPANSRGGFEDDRLDFNPGDVTHKLVLSRVVEPLRFSVGPELLEDALTQESMVAAFTRHFEFLRDDDDRKRSEAVAADPETDFKPLSSDAQVQRLKAHSDALAEIVDSLEQAFGVINHDHSVKDFGTFGDAFDFEFPSFPETTADIRAKLHSLSDNDVISRSDVKKLVCGPDGEGGKEADEVIDFIFASGAELLPREVYRDIVGCLGQHPRGVSFVQTFVSQSAETARAMSMLLIHLILLFVILGVTPQIVRSSHLQLHENTLHWINNDWAQGCPDGPTSPYGCNFLSRTFLEASRPEQDVLRYLRTELINIIWRNETAPRDMPLGGMFPVGSLVIRGVRGFLDGEANTHGCDSLNLTRPTFHFEVPASFDCGHDWAIQIPYSVNRSEALRLASTVQLPPKEITSTYAIITHFAAYQPSDGLVVYAKILFTFPDGGGAMPRYYISPIDPETHKFLLLPMVLKVIGFVFTLVFTVRYGSAGVSWFWSFALDTMLTCMILAAYIMLRSISGIIKNVDQTDFAPQDFDAARDVHDEAMSLFGFFVLIFVTSTIFFSKHIQGLQLLYDILKAAALEILGLIFMFFIWSFGFICVAMVLFGPTVTEMSNIATTTQHLLNYFSGQNDFNLLLENNPITGPVFFFVYSLFVIFFALNLLIAVLTAPLSRVKENNTLQATIYERTRALLGEGPVSARVLFSFQYYVLWPFMNLLLDCNVFTHGHWLRMKRALDTFYSIKSGGDPVEMAVTVVRSGATILSMLTPVSKEEEEHREAERSRRNSRSADLNGSSGPTETRTVNVNPAPSASKSAPAAQEDSVSSSTGSYIAGVRKVQKLPNLWNSPLVRVIVMVEAIPEHIALALTLVAVSEETSFTVVRDARLMRALRDYEGFHSSIRAVADLQSKLAPEAAKKCDSLRRLVQAAEIVRADPGKSRLVKDGIADMHEANRGRFENVVDRVAERLKEQEKSRRASALAEPTLLGAPDPMVGEISPVQSEKEGADPSHVQPQDSIMPGSARGAELDTPRKKSKEEKKVDDDDDDDDVLPQHFFYFTRGMEHEMMTASRLLFYSFTTVIFSIFFFAPFITNFSSPSHLLRSVTLGLRDQEIHTECYDPSCIRAWSMNKTFLSTGDLGEYNQWLNQVLYRQLYLRDELNLTFAGSGSTYFDPRIELRGPLKFRQLRAKHQACKDDLSDQYDARVAAARVSCHAEVDTFDSFDQAPIPYPGGVLPALMPASGYTYSDECPEREPKQFLGRFNDYPCAGHRVDIHNASQLRAFINSRWVDTDTVLVSMTADFYFGNATGLEYTMHMEFSESGGGSLGAAFGFPFASEASLQDLAPVGLVFQLLLIFDLLVSVVLFIRFLVAKYVQKLPAEIVEERHPEVPWFPLLIAFLTYVAVNIVFPPSEQATRNSLSIVILGIIYLEYNFTTAIVFPAASLMSKKVKILIRTLANALLSLFYVIPYFIIVLWGFLLGGYIIFGRFMLDMGRIRWAIMEVSLMSFVGDLPVQELQTARYIEAQIFILLFTCAVIIVLANMFLAMITSASGDAQEVAPAVALSEGVLTLFGYRVMYGEFFTSFLFASTKLADPESTIGRIAPSVLRRRRQKESALMIGQERALFPTEVLVTSMHPLLVNDLLMKFPSEDLNTFAYSALGPFLLEHLSTFQLLQPHKRAHDIKELMRAEQAVAVGRLLTGEADRKKPRRLSQSADAMGATPQRRLSASSAEVAPVAPRNETNLGEIPGESQDGGDLPKRTVVDVKAESPGSASDQRISPETTRSQTKEERVATPAA